MQLVSRIPTPTAFRACEARDPRLLRAGELGELSAVAFPLCCHLGPFWTLRDEVAQQKTPP